MQTKRTPSWKYWLVPLCLLAFLTVQASADLPAARISGIGRNSEADKIQEYIGDALIPVLGDEDGFLFLDVRAMTTEGTLRGDDYSEDEANFGLGYRHLLSDYGVILGVNAFYDRRWTSYHNELEQFGGGVELLSEYFDARFNFYDPDEDLESSTEIIDVTVEEEQTLRHGTEEVVNGRRVRRDIITTRTIETTEIREHIEEGLPGYDAEIGVRLPYLPDWLHTRLYLGMYDFDSDISEDIRGYRWRAEWRPVRIFQLDVEFYEDEELNNADYFVSGRVNVPFDIARLVQGQNPFAGIGKELKPQPFRLLDRMTEPVYRDFRIRTGYTQTQTTSSQTVGEQTKSRTRDLGEEDDDEEQEKPDGPLT